MVDEATELAATRAVGPPGRWPGTARRRAVLVLVGAYLLLVAVWFITLREPRMVSRSVADLLNLLGGGVLATVIVVQVAQRRRAATELRQERRFRAMVQYGGDIIAVLDAAGVVRYRSPVAETILGYPTPAIVGRSVLELVHPDDLPRARELLTTACAQPGRRVDGAFRARRQDGSWAELEVVAASFLDRPELQGIVLNCRDVSQRKQAERELRQRELAFASLVEHANDMIAVYDLQTGLVTFANVRFCQVTGYTREELTQLPLRAFIHPDDVPAATERRQRRQRGEPVSGEAECRLVGKTGQVVPVAYTVTELDAGDLLSGALLIGRDISERMAAEQQIRRQLTRLEALHATDLAMTGSRDPRRTVGVALHHLMTQLQVEAADVLLLDPTRMTLTYLAGIGLPEEAIVRTEFPAHEGLAGSAVLERRTVVIANLAQRQQIFDRARRFVQSGFASYHAMPLIAGGEVKGVLEVLQRTPTAPSAEWRAFLEDLGDRLAVALDNAGLFTALQRANTELTVAYEATLEGWARTLELRDGETEGHSRRVAGMTVALARALGVDEEALVQLRRGALLHDIGKIAIPDQILLKPGPLTEAEWAIMRQHPVYAYEVLAPIPFLRPALAIPRHHHERWDGSGYPDGLREQVIPFAARIFAVVDVWDALISDRPYRPAWSTERADAYVAEHAATDFDPRVVDAFRCLRAAGLPASVGGNPVDGAGVRGRSDVSAHPAAPR